MAKPLVFALQGAQIAFEMTKVDRAKLYGTKELEMLDELGGKCELATLAEDGHTIIGRGGTGIGYLSADGQWCDKTQLQPVDLSGQPIKLVPSSFAAPIVLDEPTTADDYLQHTIRGIYWLAAPQLDCPLLKRLRSGAIYKFPYSYRGGLEADVGFLLCNDVGELFMAVGSTTAIQFVGLAQAAAAVDAEADDDSGDEADEMDFSMI